jgi:hypothetical protein
MRNFNWHKAEIEVKKAEAIACGIDGCKNYRRLIQDEDPEEWRFGNVAAVDAFWIGTRFAQQPYFNK